ncbi:hypothetical protein ASC84_14355 [Acinetobacter sp. Root1280]|nr:hypothetical protein ASC84_14355 [Acinetobacter sp. Root1280]
MIHSHGIRPDYYTSFHNYSDKVKVSTQHNIIFDEYRVNFSYFRAKLIEKIWSFSLMSKDAVVGIGEVATKYYIDLLPRVYVKNIPNGRTIYPQEISSIDFEAIKKFKKNYICIGTCTRVIKLKGHIQILNALSYLKNYCFILVGDGDYLNFLKKEAENLGISDRCLFLGKKTNAIDYIKYFDIYSQTSFSESISIALLEAAALKKAIVCSNIPANRDVFSNKEVSFFEVNNVGKLIEAIDRAASFKELFQENVYKRYKLNYTAEVMAATYYELYKSLTNEV